MRVGESLQNRSTESLHLLERLQHTVPAAFRRMPWIGRARGFEPAVPKCRIVVPTGDRIAAREGGVDGLTPRSESKVSGLTLDFSWPIPS